MAVLRHSEMWPWLPEVRVVTLQPSGSVGHCISTERVARAALVVVLRLAAVVQVETL
jgi:hypothetical protein